MSKKKVKKAAGKEAAKSPPKKASRAGKAAPAVKATSSVKAKATQAPAKTAASTASRASEKSKKAAPAPTPAPEILQPFVRRKPTVCMESSCENEPQLGDYCRMHYIQNWKKIKRKELILKEKKLNQYIEELVNKYPEKYIDAIRVDLMNDKEFAKMVADLELADAVEEGEDPDTIDSLLDNIRRDMDVSASGAGGAAEDDEEF